MAPGRIHSREDRAPAALSRAAVREQRRPRERRGRAPSPEALRDWFAERGLMERDDARQRRRPQAGDRRARGPARRAAPQQRHCRSTRSASSGSTGRSAAPACACASTPGRDPELVPDAAGVDGAIARLMAIVAAAVEHGRWERLKACPREECEWAFYDKSKNRSGRWCIDGVLRQHREGARPSASAAGAQLAATRACGP